MYLQFYNAAFKGTLLRILPVFGALKTHAAAARQGGSCELRKTRDPSLKEALKSGSHKST